MNSTRKAIFFAVALFIMLFAVLTFIRKYELSILPIMTSSEQNQKAMAFVCRHPLFESLVDWNAIESSVNQ